MNNTLIAEAGCLFLLFLIAAFFSSSETALISLSRTRTRFLMSENPGKAKGLSVWFNEPNRLLTTILVGFNIAAIVSEKLALSLVHKLFLYFGWTMSDQAMEWIATVFIILAVVMAGEIIPKIYAVHNPKKMALASINLLVIFDKMVAPLTRLFTMAAMRIISMAGGIPKKQPLTSEAEIRRLITLGSEEGILEPREKDMLHGVFDFGDTVAKQLMIPREKMVCVNIEDKTEMIIEKIIEQGYSRLPVYRKDLDNIIGIIYAKDLLNLWLNRSLIILQDIIRQPYIVPPDRLVSELLREFRQGKIHMAIVVDQSKKVLGLVTLEDLIERVFGQIDDEYDFEDRKHQAGIMELPKKTEGPQMPAAGKLS